MTEIWIYWMSTTLLALLYVTSAALYVVKAGWVRQTLIDFGYPAYLHPVLIVVKLLAVIAILSRFSVFLSDLAYAGVFYHLILSALAHLGVKKPAGAIPALAGLMLLTASFATQNSARELPSPYPQIVVNRS
ncbi:MULTISPECIES: DoxX family protein [Serratia]|uniref:DoxX family protein n=1 Tax=Serratia inhibens TaxID=2338073 RepID=A0AA93BZN8_9GAMM|nr:MULTISPECIES: DoxX family protein [Serratia]NIC29377.1 DoxX family protein [Serratia plymuthica]QPS88830.1 DoxX family protein [Serratia plymuthica]RJF57986.1 DoxX family protein [Serratia inhibens]